MAGMTHRWQHSLATGNQCSPLSDAIHWPLQLHMSSHTCSLAENVSKGMDNSKPFSDSCSGSFERWRTSAHFTHPGLVPGVLCEVIPCQVAIVCLHSRLDMRMSWIMEHVIRDIGTWVKFPLSAQVVVFARTLRKCAQHSTHLAHTYCTELGPRSRRICQEWYR